MELYKRTKRTLIQLICSFLSLNQYYKIFQKSKHFQSLLEININDYIAFYIHNKFKNDISKINKYVKALKIDEERKKIIYFKILFYFEYILDFSDTLYIEDFVKSNIIKEYKIIDGSNKSFNLFELFKDKKIIYLYLTKTYNEDIIAYENNTNNFEKLKLSNMSFLNNCINKNLSFENLVYLKITINSNEEIVKITQLQSIKKLTLYLELKPNNNNESLTISLNFEKLIQLKNLNTLKLIIYNYFDELILTKEVLSKIRSLKIINKNNEHIFFKVNNYSKNDKLTLKNIEEFILDKTIITADLDLPNLKKLKLFQCVLKFNNILLKSFPNFEQIFNTIEKNPKINKKLISKYLEYVYFDNEIIANENKIKEIEYEDENIFLYYSIKERIFKIKIFYDKENINYLSFIWEFDLMNKKNNKINEIDKYSIKENKKSQNNKIIINEKNNSKSIIIKSFQKVEEINLELYDFKQINSFNCFKGFKNLISCKLSLKTDDSEILYSKEMKNFLKNISLSQDLKTFTLKTQNIKNINI